MKDSPIKNFLVCYVWEKYRSMPFFHNEIYINPEYIISIQCIDYEFEDDTTLKGYKLIVDDRENTMQVFTYDLEKTYDNTTDL